MLSPTQPYKTFAGQEGISPQIDFNNAIDLNGFEKGVTTLTLDVKDETGSNKIGTLTALFNSGAVASVTNSTIDDMYTYMSVFDDTAV